AAQDGTYAQQVLELPHGSVFVLGWQTNQEWTHGIRPDGRSDAEKREDELRDGCQRISLTMRSVATFRAPDGQIYGQGARRKTLETPPHDHDPVDEAQRMLTAFG